MALEKTDERYIDSDEAEYEDLSEIAELDYEEESDCKNNDDAVKLTYENCELEKTSDTQKNEETNNTIELINEYKRTGDIEIRNRIVMENISIAKNVAYQMRGILTEYAQIDDAINQGIMALMECIDRFDTNKGVKFQTFAYLRVRGSIIDFVRQQDWVPRKIRLVSKNINKAHDALCSELMREPTTEELAERLKIKADELNKWYGEIFSASTLSLEGTIQGIYLSDTNDDIADDEEAVDSHLLKNELKEVLKKSIDELTEREKLAVSLYYYEELKQAEVAEVMQISEQRVSQILSKAIQKMKYKIKLYMQGEL